MDRDSSLLRMMVKSHLQRTHPQWFPIETLIWHTDHVRRRANPLLRIECEWNKHVRCLIADRIKSGLLELSDDKQSVRLAIVASGKTCQVIRSFFRRRALPGHFGCSMNAVADELRTHRWIASHDKRAADLLAPVIVERLLADASIHEHDGLLYAVLPNKQRCSLRDCIEHA